MLQASAVIAFAASDDLRQARGFYEHVLGLRLVEQNDFACVFDANGTMLRVTAVAEVAGPATPFSAGGCPISRPPYAASPPGVSHSCATTAWTKMKTVFCTTPTGDKVRMVRRSGRNRPVAYPVRLDERSS